MPWAKGRWHPEESRGKVTEPLRADGCVRPNANVVPGHALGSLRGNDGGNDGSVHKGVVERAKNVNHATADSFLHCRCRYRITQGAAYNTAANLRPRKAPTSHEQP